MTTGVPILVPAVPAGGSEGGSASLPVTLSAEATAQAFPVVLEDYFQPQTLSDGLLMTGLPLQEGAMSPLHAVLPITPEQGLALPMQGLEAIPDGKDLPLSPEMMWSGMLLINDSGAAGGPLVYQLAEDGQSLAPQAIDPNTRAALQRAMNRFAPLSASYAMPEVLNATGLDGQLAPGLGQNSSFFFATAAGPGGEETIQMLTEQFAAPLLTADSDATAPSLNLNSLGIAQLGDAAASYRSAGMVADMPVSPNHPQWPQALGERLQWLVQQNLQQADIRLNPPELGALEVRVQLGSDQQAQVSFTSPNASVREALEAAIPRLREMFADTGLNLVDVNVSHQSLADQRESGAFSSSGDQARAQNEASVTDEPGEVTAPGRAQGVGLVDLYA